MRGPPPGYNVPRGYVPRGGQAYEPRDARDPRDPRAYQQHRHHGPSPWIPATILGVILLITGMPWMRTASTIYPDPVIAYQAAAAAAARPSYSFPLPLLWIPVLAIIGFQFFGGNWPYYGDGYGFRGGRGAVPGAMYGGRGGYRGDAYAPGAYRNRGVDPEYNRGWGGWWPWSGPSGDENNRYNNHQQRGLMSMFMDYGGHWFLILLGIAVFSLVSASASSLPSHAPAVLPVPPLAPQTLGFPWSLFF